MDIADEFIPRGHRNGTVGNRALIDAREGERVQDGGHRSSFCKAIRRARPEISDRDEKRGHQNRRGKAGEDEAARRTWRCDHVSVLPRRTTRSLWAGARAEPGHGNRIRGVAADRNPTVPQDDEESQSPHVTSITLLTSTLGRCAENSPIPDGNHPTRTCVQPLKVRCTAVSGLR